MKTPFLTISAAAAALLLTSCHMSGDSQFQTAEQIVQKADIGDYWGDSPAAAQRALQLQEAAKYYRIAAEQGHTDAQFKLACLYDDAARENWGSKNVFINLGGNYRSVSEYRAEAEKWYLKAIRQGHAQAAENYDLFKRTGTGTTTITYPANYTGPTYQKAALGNG